MAGTLAEDDLGGGEHLAALHDVPAHDVFLQSARDMWRCAPWRDNVPVSDKI